jgi:hypothetical protein
MTAANAMLSAPRRQEPRRAGADQASGEAEADDPGHVGRSENQPNTGVDRDQQVKAQT